MRQKKSHTLKDDLLKLGLPILFVVLLGFALAIASLDPPPPRHLTLAAGSPGGAYHSYSLRYRELLGRDGYELEVLETAGSNENLRLLRAGEADLALIQGGTVPAGSAGEDSGLETIATLFFEPVWIFHRVELEIERLGELAGRRIAVGPEGSGTRSLALQLLAANGLEPDTLGGLADIGGSAAARELASGIVDAAFFVASPEAPYMQELLTEPGLELFDAARQRAYHHRFPFLSPVVLGEGVFDLAANIPDRDVPLLAAAAGLVAREDLHDGLVPLLLGALERVHGDRGLFSVPGEFPSTRWAELPFKPEAQIFIEQGPSFLHRILPFRWASGIDRLKILLLPFLTLLIPLFRAAPPLYRWRIRSKIYRWYEDLRQIDDVVFNDGVPLREELEQHLEALRVLEEEVADVSVPLSYMDEYYRLRDHIELVAGKLNKLEALQIAAPANDAEEVGVGGRA